MARAIVRAVVEAVARRDEQLSEVGTSREAKARREKRWRLWALRYFVLQGASGVMWWMFLFAYPQHRVLFHPVAFGEDPLLSFWLADSVCFIGGSLLAALALWRGGSQAARPVWFVTGAVWFGALYCAQVTLQTGEAWVAAVSMLLASLMSGLFASRCC